MLMTAPCTSCCPLLTKASSRSGTGSRRWSTSHPGWPTSWSAARSGCTTRAEEWTRWWARPKATPTEQGEALGLAGAVEGAAVPQLIDDTVMVACEADSQDPHLQRGHRSGGATRADRRARWTGW
jgi:hypothetical protein